MGWDGWGVDSDTAQDRPIGLDCYRTMDRTKYPDNWDEIAATIKDRAGWKCEQCGLVPISRRRIRHAQTNVDGGDRIDRMENGFPPENLVALCPRCHLAYDQTRKVMQETKAKKRIKYIAEHVVLGHGNALIKKRWKLRIPPQKRSKGIFQSIVTASDYFGKYLNYSWLRYCIVATKPIY